MNWHIMRSGLLTGIAVLAGSVMADAGPVEAANAKQGKLIAQQHCSRCHVVPNYNTMGIGSTPSFRAMIQSPAKDWRHKFEAFFSLPPHGNFVRIREYRQVQATPSSVAPIVLGLEDLEHLMTYVDELSQELRNK